MKKLTALLLALVLVFSLATCGTTNDTPTDPKPNQTDPTETEPAAKYKVPTKDVGVWQEMSLEAMQQENVDSKPVAYQFVGYHAQEGKNTSVLMNLYEDGSARIFQYTDGGEGTLTYIYYGYWTSMDDAYLYTAYMGYSYEGPDRESMGIHHGDLCTLDYSYELSEQDGLYSFSINACLGFKDGGQYVRSAEVIGDGSVQHATIAAWTAAADAYWAALKES